MAANILRLVTPEELNKQQAKDDAAYAANTDAATGTMWTTSLASFIEGEYSRFQRHRDGANGWSDRLSAAMRTFKGEYDTETLQEISKFGGSKVYARITASKCRGASSLLRDVYLGPDKPWGLEATPDPTMPDDIMGMITQLVQVEVMNMQRMGQAVDPTVIRDRTFALYHAAKKASLKKARSEAEEATKKLDDILTEGQFYEALAAFLVDLPLFPFACIKGPVVRITPSVRWVNGRAVMQDIPKMFWYRVSPYDIWWTPGVSDIAQASVIEKTRLTRADFSQLIGLPGYNDDALRAVLQDYQRSGYVSSQTASSDSTRATLESREDPRMNESGIIDMLEYHGWVPGSTLIEWGLSAAEVPDPDRDYFVDAYKVGNYVIKCQLSPSVKKRAPYYVTSFEKVPGTVVGNALPDILADMQSVGNAALRAMVNNMAISSGPQVVIDDERVAPNNDSDELFPWKRWHTRSDPMSNNNSSVAPVTFTQPNSNAQELLGVYKEVVNIADDLSAIPKYVTGSDRLGGAGRTASGLAMLMGNAAKILQTVAANVDRDVIYQILMELYDLVMLTDTTGMLRGDESIKVLGVNVAVQRETQRQRQLEFLQATMNPADMAIMGVKGRARVLRHVSEGIGMPGEDVVPPEDEMPPAVPMGGPGQGGGPSAGPDGPPMIQGPQQPAIAGPQQANTNVVQ